MVEKRTRCVRRRDVSSDDLNLRKLLLYPENPIITKSGTNVAMKLKSYGKASNKLMPLHKKVATGHKPVKPRISK